MYRFLRKLLMFNKEKSIAFWDEVGEEWGQRAYAKDDNYYVFPSAENRNAVLIENFKNQFKHNQSFLDIGCADGDLVIDLRKTGFEKLRGIDNSVEMVNVAMRKIL